MEGESVVGRVGERVRVEEFGVRFVHDDLFLRFFKFGGILETRWV